VECNGEPEAHDLESDDATEYAVECGAVSDVDSRNGCLNRGGEYGRINRGVPTKVDLRQRLAEGKTLVTSLRPDDSCN